MNMTDTRISLPRGYKLLLDNYTYTICDVVGRGGSCIAYNATAERSNGMPQTPVIIKEFYPLELVSPIARGESNALTVHETYSDEFEHLKTRFIGGAYSQVAFTLDDSNHSLPLPTLYFANGTAYTVVVLTNGQTLDKCGADMSPYEKSCVFTSLCNAIKGLHNKSKLYLDLKPANIFVFDADDNETRRIALFDFDTAIDIANITNTLISYSDDWSPYEQSSAQNSEISYAADIYSLGAVFYWLHTGDKVSNVVLDNIARGRFNFLSNTNTSRSGRTTIEGILSATLKRVPSQRVQSIEGIPL